LKLMAILSRAARRLRALTLGSKARAVSNAGLTYLSPTKLRRIERALRAAQSVPGDFAEFGVALGGSAILIAELAKGRRFHGFDVFAMIPEPASAKDDEKSRQRYAVIQSGASRGLDGGAYYGYRSNLFEEVKNAFAEHDLSVDGQSIILHRGLFEETVPKADLQTIAFAHIDCDWYDPVRYCLTAIGDNMSAGGVIVIDDYYDYGGCRTAVDEFLSERSDFVFDEGANPILRKVALRT
jgi:asparagine synthase (glutamine-hydrolysing)